MVYIKDKFVTIVPSHGGMGTIGTDMNEVVIDLGSVKIISIEKNDVADKVRKGIDIQICPQYSGWVGKLIVTYVARNSVKTSKSFKSEIIYTVPHYLNYDYNSVKSVVFSDINK